MVRPMHWALGAECFRYGLELARVMPKPTRGDDSVPGHPKRAEGSERATSG